MRKSLFILLLILGGAALLMEPLLGVAPQHLYSAQEVSAGMGAKLACSGRYLSGLSEAQLNEDVASYSSANRLLDYRYDPLKKSVSASMFGMKAATARYREGLGCTLEIGDTAALDAVIAPATQASEAAWPAGFAVDTIAPELQAELDAMLARDNAEQLDTRALLVVKGGVVVAESYAPDINAQTPLLGWSMGKSVIAIMLAQLEHRGQLDRQARGLFPEWLVDSRSEISIQQLLQMSSGLDFDETYAPGSDSTRMLFTAHSAADVARAGALEFPPGTHFYYSSGTTNMLAKLWFERVGGSTQQALDYLSSQLLVPLGMSHTILEPDPSGVFVGSSYVYASARDWARLGLLMLNGGELNGQRFLAEDWVDAARRPNPSDNDPRYGYQFWLNAGGGELRWPQLPVDAYAMMGNRQQTVMIVPSRDMVLVRLGWTVGSYPMAENFALLLEQLVNR